MSEQKTLLGFHHRVFDLCEGRELVKRFLLEWKPDILAEIYAPQAME